MATNIILSNIKSIDKLDNNDKLIINNCNMLFDYLENSFNVKKTIKAFINTLIENNNIIDNHYVIKNNYFFIDHKSYANLFLIFDNENKILDYVQDACLARGDTIPKTINKAINYLNNENTIVYKVIEFKVDKDTINYLKNKIDEN